MKCSPDELPSVASYRLPVEDVEPAQLSERRAASVANYLGARGVDQRRISTLGFGPSQPIASNATPDGRAQNRRVEVLISPLKG